MAGSRAKASSFLIFIVWALTGDALSFVNPMLNLVIWVVTFWQFVDNIKEGMSKQTRGELGAKRSCDERA